MKKLLSLLRTWWHSDPREKYVLAGILDLSGQGRDRFGR